MDWLFAIIGMCCVFIVGIINYSFSNGLCAALIVLIIELLYCISKKNPFARILVRPKYTICNPFGAFDHEISFSKRATIDCLRESIFNVFYNSKFSHCGYRDPSIRFVNFHRWNTIVNQFYPFHFSTISFEDVDSSQFNCIDYFSLPCEKLHLPRNINNVDFSINCIPHIKELVLHSPKFVPLHYYSEAFFAQPIPVNYPLNVIVPSNLLRAYRTDPGWRSIRLETPDGDIVSPTINGLPTFDPATESRFHI